MSFRSKQIELIYKQSTYELALFLSLSSNNLNILTNKMGRTTILSENKLQ